MNSVFGKLPNISKASSDEIIDFYTKEVGRTRLLTPEEEVKLAKKIQKGDVNARNKLVLHNLRLVLSLARKFMGKGLPLMDLIQEGNIGLMKATLKFDHRKGFKFSTYAVWWIRQAITRALVEKSRIIRVPHHIVERMNKLHKELNKKYGDAALELASDEEKEEVYSLRSKTQEVISLSHMYGEDDSLTLSEAIEDTSQLSLSDRVVSYELKNAINDLLETLTSMEKEVIVHRFGLDGNEKMTFNDIGQVMGMTVQQVRRLQQKALEKLRTEGVCESLAVYKLAS